MGRTNRMLQLYHCAECAEYDRRSRCYKSGVCPYADQMEEFRALNDEREQEMYGRSKRVRNVETGAIFESMSAAERSLGAGIGTMAKILNKPTRTLKGYHWITV